MPRYENNGSDLYYASDGEGNPIVLLHCLPTDHRLWKNQVFSLSPRFKTLAPDFRGLGLSEDTDAAIDLDLLSNDILKLMEMEKIDGAVLAGVSLGAAVAQHFTVKHPDRVRALVLSGTMHTSQSESLQRHFDGRIAGYSSEDARSYYLKQLESIFSPTFATSSEGREIIRSYMDRWEHISHSSIIKLFQALKGLDLEDEISSIGVPTLIVAGELDNAFNSCKVISERIEGSIFVPVKGGGHAVNLDSPVEYNKALTAFLEKLP